MSWTVDTAFVQTYHNKLDMIFQQRGSRLRPTVEIVSQKSEYDYHDRLGLATAQAMTTRHGDTPFNPIDHTRRRLQMTGYNSVELFDNQDKLRMIIDPKDAYAQAQAFALGRQLDSTIITAATGTAVTGKTGSGTQAANTTASTSGGYQVVVNFTESGAAATSNLTIGKLREARRVLETAESIMDGEEVFFILGASQKNSLLRTTEVTSSDYNSIKALVNGTLNSFMGFTFVQTQLLAIDANNVRTCLAYPKSALKCAVGEELKVRVSERADKNYSAQVYSEATFGAVRMWEEKVVQILCDEDV